jgi:hypothetical protein
MSFLAKKLKTVKGIHTHTVYDFENAKSKV